MAAAGVLFLCHFCHVVNLFVLASFQVNEFYRLEE